MIDRATAAWARRSAIYDLLEGSDLRRGSFKRELFRRATGKTLLIAAGTGLDLPHFAGGPVIAIDLSEAMLRRARRRAACAAADVRLVAADAQQLPFEHATFESVVTSCTLCSVPDALGALREISRVLSPTGRLLMFEHQRSRDPIVGLTLDAMTIWTRRSGTYMNRHTLDAVQEAGFRIVHIRPVFLDVILAVEARPA